MPVIHGDANWPGIGGILSVEYTIGHGISPGCAMLVTQPQDTPPAARGDLQITDSINGTITVPDCRLDSVRSTISESGIRWQVTLLDRRWRWKDCGLVTGVFNVIDPTGEVTRPGPDAAPVDRQLTQYLPWTIKKNADLIKMCLQAMGEVVFTIVLPPGSDTKESLVPVNWAQGVNPAHALSQLCDQLGCRIVYRLDTDSVLITPLGIGGPLPDGPLVREGPSLKIPARPDRLTLIGAETITQIRLLAEPVGEEWNGMVMPINTLSYAPFAPPLSQVNNLVIDTVHAGDNVSVAINGTIIATVISPSNNAATFANLIAAAINANPAPAVFAVVKNAAFGNPVTTVVLTGVAGFPFLIDIVSFSKPPPIIGNECVQKCQNPGNLWANVVPPYFSGVFKTKNLTYTQAQDKASGSVYKWYRVLAVDPITGKPPLKVPVWNPRTQSIIMYPIKRVQQLIIHNFQVEQIVPPKIDGALVGADNLPFVLNFYNGLRRNKPAQGYGSYNFTKTGAKWTNRIDPNTGQEEEINVQVSIDAERYLAIFSEYIYQYFRGQVIAPNIGGPLGPIMIQTGVSVRDVNNNAPNRYTANFDFPDPTGGTIPGYIHREDVNLEIVCKYDDPANPRRITSVINNVGQCATRARYYLLNEARKYELKGALEREYFGIGPIWNDGAIQQVTWRVGESGAFTHASLNSEHSYYVPKYRERFYTQNLAPAVQDQIAPGPVRAADMALIPGLRPPRPPGA